jgi:hypothetical protein
MEEEDSFYIKLLTMYQGLRDNEKQVFDEKEWAVMLWIQKHISITSIICIQVHI